MGHVPRGRGCRRADEELQHWPEGASHPRVESYRRRLARGGVPIRPWKRDHGRWRKASFPGGFQPCRRSGCGDCSAQRQCTSRADGERHRADCHRLTRHQAGGPHILGWPLDKVPFRRSRIRGYCLVELLAEAFAKLAAVGFTAKLQVPELADRSDSFTTIKTPHDTASALRHSYYRRATRRQQLNLGNSRNSLNTN